MKGLSVVGLLLCLVLIPGGFAFAQTDTPTPSPTPTATPAPATTNHALLPPGAVVAWAGIAPDPGADWLNGWLLCDGSAVSRTDYAELFAVYDEDFGVGDGSTTFNLPDCRGRTIVGTGDGIGAALSPRNRGDLFGAEAHVLTVGEMPRHNHGGTTHQTTISGAGGNHQPFAGTNRLLALIPFEGLNEAHPNIQPSIALHYLIWSGSEETAIGGGSLETPAPEIRVYSTVEAGSVGQNVAFAYEVSAGDFMVSVLLVVIAGLLIVQTAIKVMKTE